MQQLVCENESDHEQTAKHETCFPLCLYQDGFLSIDDDPRVRQRAHCPFEAIIRCLSLLVIVAVAGKCSVLVKDEHMFFPATQKTVPMERTKFYVAYTTLHILCSGMGVAAARSPYSHIVYLLNKQALSQVGLVRTPEMSRSLFVTFFKQPPCSHPAHASYSTRA